MFSKYSPGAIVKLSDGRLFSVDETFDDALTADEIPSPDLPHIFISHAELTAKDLAGAMRL